MSALPQKADINDGRRHVRLVPEAEVAQKEALPIGTSSQPRPKGVGFCLAAAVSHSRFSLIE